MASPSTHKLFPGTGISCHAWNKDRSMLAVCPNSNVVLIFKATDIKNNKSWVLDCELREHDQLIAAIDWAPTSNRIVTVSHDRNAYVWTWQEVQGVKIWNPVLVILRMSRAATCVKWTADERKFAVGSGASCVAVCSYDETQNWWTSKVIRKHRSTVLSVAWHPTAPIIATGSADFKCRVLFAFVKDVDPKELSKINPYNNGGEAAKRPFGDLIQEYSAQGWVHSVQWSPNGNHLAFCSHDSAVTVATVNGPTQVIKLSVLPFRSLLFLSDSAILAVGHEINPHVFRQNGTTWSLAGKLDKEEAREEVQQTSAKAAMTMFQNQAKKATTDASSTDLPTQHQNSVSCIVPYSSGASHVKSVTTSGLDGYLIHWMLGDDLEKAFANLVI